MWFSVFSPPLARSLAAPQNYTGINKAFTATDPHLPLSHDDGMLVRFGQLCYKWFNTFLEFVLHWSADWCHHCLLARRPFVFCIPFEGSCVCLVLQMGWTSRGHCIRVAWSQGFARLPYAATASWPAWDASSSPGSGGKRKTRSWSLQQVSVACKNTTTTSPDGRGNIQGVGKKAAFMVPTCFHFPSIQQTGFISVCCCFLAVEKKAAVRHKRDDLVRRKPEETETGAEWETRTHTHDSRLITVNLFSHMMPRSFPCPSSVLCVLQSQIWPAGLTARIQTHRLTLTPRTERRSLWRLWPAPTKTWAAT